MASKRKPKRRAKTRTIRCWVWLNSGGHPVVMGAGHAGTPIVVYDLLTVRGDVPRSALAEATLTWEVPRG